MRYYTPSALFRASLICLGAICATGTARAEESLVQFFAHADPAQESAAIASAPAARGRRHALRDAHVGGHVSLAGVFGALAAKARQIEGACGSTVISGYRRTRVAGTRHMSLHASGHAVDMRGNPGCIYAQLKGWPGGYSTDYGRVKHVHISLGGSEDGLRFAHGGGGVHYAQNHHRHSTHRRFASL